MLKLAKEYKNVQSRDDEGRYVIPEEKRTKAVPKDGYKVLSEIVKSTYASKDLEKSGKQFVSCIVYTA